MSSRCRRSVSANVITMARAPPVALSPTSPSSEKSIAASLNACASINCARQPSYSLASAPPACRSACRACASRLRVHQVGDRLGLGQVDLAVLEGAPRELARLCQPRPGDRAERPQHRQRHSAPAVHVELGHDPRRSRCAALRTRAPAPDPAPRLSPGAGCSATPPGAGQRAAPPCARSSRPPPALRPETRPARCAQAHSKEQKSSALIGTGTL